MVKQWVIKKPSSEFSNTIISRPLGRVITLLRAKICGSLKFRNYPPKSNSILTTQITAQFPRYIVVLQFIAYSTMIFNMGILHLLILSLGWWFCFCIQRNDFYLLSKPITKVSGHLGHWLRWYMQMKIASLCKVYFKYWELKISSLINSKYLVHNY